VREIRAELSCNRLHACDRNLMSIRACEDVSQLHLDFTVVDDRFGETSVTELVPGGQDIPVTNDNRVRCVHTRW